MPSIVYLFTGERLDETAQAGILHTIRTNTHTSVRICSSKSDAMHAECGWSPFIARLLQEFSADSSESSAPIASFEFISEDAPDVLHRFVDGLLEALYQEDATTAHLIRSVAHLIARCAVQSAQALPHHTPISARCRHAAKQVATHLLKLGIRRTSPPYDLVAAIALDMFLRGQTAGSIEQLQEAIGASNVATVRPLVHRSFKRVVVHTDISFHHKATEADIDDQHAVVFVLSKSLGDDTDPYPNSALDIVLSARHKDADICVSDGVAAPLTTPASVLELVKEQVLRWKWAITTETQNSIVAWSDEQQRALTINVHSESLDDNGALEETLLHAFQHENKRFVTLVIGPVTPSMARLYASCSRVISGTSVDEGVNSGMASKDPRLMGGMLLPELCVAHPMYDFGHATDDFGHATDGHKSPCIEDDDDDRPVLMNLKANVSRFLYTPNHIIQHPDVVMAQYEYALKTVSRPYWRCKSSSMEVRLAYSNGLTTPHEGPFAVVDRLRRYIEQRSEISTVLDDYRSQHPIDTNGRIVECAMQHAATVVLNVLTEFDASDAALSLRKQYVAFIHDGSVQEFEQLHAGSRRDEWDHTHLPSTDRIAAVVRSQMPDATPKSVACLLRCMLALFLHRFVQIEYARVASGLPHGDLVWFRRALPHATVDDASSAVYYRLDEPCCIGECPTLTIP